MKTLLIASLLTLNAFAAEPVFKTGSYQKYVQVTSPLTQVALAKIRPEHVADFKRIVNGLLPRMKAQKGNSGYTYSQNQEDPTEFVFYEKWDNGASIKNHMESKLVQGFFGEVGKFFEPGFPQLIITKVQGEN